MNTTYTNLLAALESFRDALEAADTLEDLQSAGIALVTATEAYMLDADKPSAFQRGLLNLRYALATGDAS